MKRSHSIVERLYDEADLINGEAHFIMILVPSSDPQFMLSLYASSFRHRRATEMAASIYERQFPHSPTSDIEQEAEIQDGLGQLWSLHFRSARTDLTINCW